MINNFYKGVSLSETSDPISRPDYQWKLAAMDDTVVEDSWPDYETINPDVVTECERCGKRFTPKDTHLSLASAYSGRVIRTVCRDCSITLLEKLVRKEI